MKEFLSDNFLLDNKTSEILYFDYAKDMPIIDYHNHLPPQEIAENRQFDNLTQIWLNDDHYKWRAMRSVGIDEKYITGDATDKEKFIKWAETLPHTLRNPLYHWTHLELQRYFNINTLLNQDTAEAIYEETTQKLQKPDFRVHDMLYMMNVEVVCTTDDPLDDLQYHKKNTSEVKVLPTFRPDKAMNVQNTIKFNIYLKDLSKVSGIQINSFDSYMEALQSRHAYFHKNGCRLSDHGLNYLPFESYSIIEVQNIFKKLLKGIDIEEAEALKIQTAILLELGKMDHARGWTQQFHLGPIRNTNKRLYEKLGPDTGFDSIGDFPQAASMAKFFGELDRTDQLAKTIIYNLNPGLNEVFASMTGNFNDGSIKGKIQFGSAWWYSDQLDGMEKQINALSNIGLLSCFVGMLTDSRSFLSFPRHEYFRRLLCNILGQDIEKGLVPNDLEMVGGMVRDICYNNAKEYFKFE